MRRFIPVFLLIAAVGMLFPARPVSARMLNKPDRTHYTGRQIFEGAFFGIGPVAKIVYGSGEFATGGTTPSGRVNNFAKGMSSLEARIQAHDPSYFSKLRADMTSGDPGLVRQAVVRTNNDLKSVATVTLGSQAASPDGTVLINDTAALNQYIYLQEGVVALAVAAVAIMIWAAMLVLPVREPVRLSSFQMHSYEARFALKLEGR